MRRISKFAGEGLTLEVDLVDWVTGPRVHYVGAIVAIVGAAASLAATGYAASQSPPKLPNGASSSRQVAQATAAQLPINRQMAAAEQQGGKGSFWSPTHKEPQQFIKVPTGLTTHQTNDRTAWDAATAGVLPGGSEAGFHFTDFMGMDDKGGSKLVPYVASEWEQGGKYNKDGKIDQAWITKHTRTRNVKVAGHQQEYDFTGKGTADIEGQLANKMADIQTELGAKYGTQFASESAREAALADPEGTKARAMENDLIQQQIQNPKPINPLSTSLDSAIDSQVKAGGGLDAMSRDLLDQELAKTNADRGGSGVTADSAANNMSTGMQGAARRQAGINKAQAWLSSGSTPEDIQWRREQQNLANLGAFIGGQTPESQFGNLSGAGQGATPMYPGGQLPQQPNNAGAAGMPYSVAAWQQNLRAQQGQSNGWMAGLSALLSATGTASSALGTH